MTSNPSGASSGRLLSELRSDLDSLRARLEQRRPRTYDDDVMIAALRDRSADPAMVASLARSVRERLRAVILREASYLRPPCDRSIIRAGSYDGPNLFPARMAAILCAHRADEEPPASLVESVTESWQYDWDWWKANPDWGKDRWSPFPWREHVLVRTAIGTPDCHGLRAQLDDLEDRHELNPFTREDLSGLPPDPMTPERYERLVAPLQLCIDNFGLVMALNHADTVRVANDGRLPTSDGSVKRS